MLEDEESIEYCVSPFMARARSRIFGDEELEAGRNALSMSQTHSGGSGLLRVVSPQTTSALIERHGTFHYATKPAYIVRDNRANCLGTVINPASKEYPFT